MCAAGAEFVPELRTEGFQTIWRKGVQRDADAYAVTAQHPGFPQVLRADGVTSIAVCGIATNICCFYAARDLRRQGFRVLLIEDASAGIDVAAADLCQHKAKTEGVQIGIEYATLPEVRGSSSDCDG